MYENAWKALPDAARIKACIFFLWPFETEDVKPFACVAMYQYCTLSDFARMLIM